MDFGQIFAETPLLAGLDGGVPQQLAELAERVDLPSGAVLYRPGDASTDCFIVASGRLRVLVDGSVVGYVGRLQPVGEMGLITGEPRSATVQAVRDSIVLRIAGPDFLAFMERHSSALMALSRLVIERLREQGRRRMQSATEVQGTFAIVPASRDVPVMALAEALVRRLSGWPTARLITAAHVDAALGEGTAQTAIGATEAATRLLGWLNELEGRHRYVIFAAENSHDAWALRCLHSADRVLVLGEAGQEPQDLPVLVQSREAGVPAPVEVVLLRPDGDPSPHTLAWRERTGARAHYFVHPWDDRELASLARQVTGQGVCLVLGGGGARGFAHIGLIRALEELGIPVDACGGTSMGAFMGALVATGLDSVEMANVARETFVAANYLNDYALPRVSLIRGHKFGVRLGEIFEQRRIEELRRTFFCISANLTTGATVVHDSGPLAVWVGTSMAIPGVAPPIAFEGDLLCDGGVVDNLPTDVMQRLERGAIVASNVSSDGDVRATGAGLGEPDPGALLRRGAVEAAPRFRSILMRSATLTPPAQLQLAADRADHYLRMPTQGFGLFDWKRLDELIELGHEAALEQLGPMRDELRGPAP